MIKFKHINSLASFRYMATYHYKYSYPMLGCRKNYYDVLNVPANSSISEIKEAYFKLSKKYHPDGNSSVSDAEEFVKICEAYKVLYKRASRDSYDDQMKTKFCTVSSPDINRNNQNIHKSWTKYHATIRRKQFRRNLPFFKGSSIFQQKNLRASKTAIIPSSLIVISPKVADNHSEDEQNVRVTYAFNSSDYKSNWKYTYYLTGFGIIGALLATDWLKNRRRRS